MRVHPLSILAVLLVIFVASGSSCPQMVRQVSSPSMRVLPNNPTLEQVMLAVNQNGSQINSLSISQASISVGNFPALRKANLAAERVRKFRLRAGTMFGDEVDIGSNDELFWIWVRRNNPPSMFHCRHDQFATSSARQLMPVEPEWLFEALGATTIDPNERHEGPTPVGSGRLQIRSSRQSSLGELVKVTIIDEASAWVLEQHVYDPRSTNGQPLASSFTRAHRKDPVTGLVMPQQVEIQWPPANFSMRIDIQEMRINSLEGDPNMLWAKPEYPGYTNIDLADPNIRFLQPNQNQTAVQPGHPAPQLQDSSQRTGWFN